MNNNNETNTTETEAVAAEALTETPEVVSDTEADLAESLSALEQAAKEMGVALPGDDAPATSQKAASKPRKPRAAAISDEDFMDTWQASARLSDVCTVLGVSSTTASQRAAVLRASGKNLKVFPRGRRPGQKNAGPTNRSAFETKASLRAEIASLRELLDKATI